MSYDLCFWSERPGVRLPAQTVYEHLLDGKAVDGLVPLPVEDYLATLAESFGMPLYDAQTGERFALAGD